MLRYCLLFLTALWINPGLAAEPDNGAKKPFFARFSLPGTQLDAAISTPDEFLAYPLGQWHLRHDQANYYLRRLEQQSPRLTLETTGQSHEARQQLTAVISSPQNLARLPEILQHRAEVKSGVRQSGPLVIWLAYSIHGDEASGAHAALALSYYLSASREPWVTELLQQAIVLITPSQNPDGMDRFATWANSHRSQSKNPDEHNREHLQDWPGGRSNHYLADLNRDWLFLRHPESRGRVALFHKWQPHYVGDFHEMNPDKSYFFQPGIAARTHPLTPKGNQRLTQKLAGFHQQALDKAGQTYFSGQLFDDFFYGKGSTYPDINGAIGVLFEQAATRGQWLESASGELSLQQAISNQFTTSLSSLRGALALKAELQQYQSDFYNTRKKRPQQGRQQGMLVRAPHDSARRDDMADLLHSHGIRFFYLSRPLEQDHARFTPQDSLFIPLAQPQRSLLQALFDKRREFADTSFYDISSWDLQSAYGLSMHDRARLDPADLSPTPPSHQTASWPASARALLLDWRQGNAAPMLQQLLQAGIRVKYAAKPFSLETSSGEQSFVRGTLQIPLIQQPLPLERLNDIIAVLSRRFAIQLTPVASSASASGIDLGSPDFRTIAPVKALLVGGRGSEASEVGELWYYMDKKLGLPVTLSDGDKLAKMPLARYSHIIMVDGDYGHLDEVVARKLGQFTTRGGVIIAQKGALAWLNKRHLLSSELHEERYFKQLFSAEGLTFADKDKFEARQQIGGAIMALQLDSSHPLSFGLTASPLPVMKDKRLGIAETSEPFVIIGQYADEPLLSGFLAKEYQRTLANAPALLMETKGKGAVVALADNLMFRNFWLGAEKVYANALYFIQAHD